MLQRKLIMVAWVALWAGAGCVAERGAEVQERTGVGKADSVGTCLGTDCDGQAASGDCWCDEQCDIFGDCCADRQALCEIMACGGETGTTCPSGFYCERSPATACGAEGLCRFIEAALQDCLVTDAVAAGAVCGCDGVAYEDACQAIAAGTHAELGSGACTGGFGSSCVAQEGGCDEGLICFPEGGTCSVGGKTPGTCSATPEACRSNRVCGCDGNDYVDECAAFAAGVEVASTGFCDAACNAPIPEACRERGPVCGCDGNTYASECAAYLQGEVNVQSEGACS